jgi:Protein of unknown function (DUF4239)
MLTIPGKILTVFLIVGSALGFKIFLDRVWSREKRRRHNNVIGWELGITGTTYAVMLGFMLYTVWSDMGAADLNATQEANAITNIHRLAEDLPSPQREQLKTAARAYVHSVIEEDWPAMERGQLEELKSHTNNRDIWRILATVKPTTPEQLVALDHSFYEVSALAEHRRVRYLECESRLPTILWLVLIFGCLVTIASCCLFGSSETWLHSTQVFCFSLLVAVILTAIADIDEPFKGSVRISDHAFRHALQNMDEQ